MSKKDRTTRGRDRVTMFKTLGAIKHHKLTAAYVGEKLGCVGWLALKKDEKIFAVKNLNAIAPYLSRAQIYGLEFALNKKVINWRGNSFLYKSRLVQDKKLAKWKKLQKLIVVR